MSANFNSFFDSYYVFSAVAVCNIFDTFPGLLVIIDKFTCYVKFFVPRSINDTNTLHCTEKY